MVYNVKVRGKEFVLRLERDGENWTCQLGGRLIPILLRSIAPNVLLLIVEGKTYDVRRDQFGKRTRAWINHQAHPIEIFDPRSLSSYSRNRTKSTASQILASMPGKVIRVLAKEGEHVQAGQALMVVEAMKMQNEIKSQNEGMVKQMVSEGARVNAGDVLAVVE